MLPHERSLVQRMQGKPFVMIGITADDSADKFKQVLQKEQVNWPNILDGPNGPIHTAWNIHSQPHTYVIDSKGVIRYVNVFGEKLDDAVNTLLKEMGESVPASNEK